MDVRRADRSLTDVLADILRNVQEILYSEIRLAQAELRDEMGRARPGATLIVAAVAGAVLSAAFVLLAILEALRLVMPAWAAALCVGIPLAVVSAIAMTSGIKRLRALSLASMKPHVKESMEWSKRQSG